MISEPESFDCTSCSLLLLSRPAVPVPFILLSRRTRSITRILLDLLPPRVLLVAVLFPPSRSMTTGVHGRLPIEMPPPWNSREKHLARSSSSRRFSLSIDHLRKFYLRSMDNSNTVNLPYFSPSFSRSKSFESALSLSLSLTGYFSAIIEVLKIMCVSYLRCNACKKLNNIIRFPRVNVDPSA